MMRSTLFALAAFCAIVVNAERHIVHFENRCECGTPILLQGGNILSTGEDYISNGSLVSAIAYLQDGSCGFNGENCTLLETTLTNAVTAGGGSSTDLSLISPHAFSVKTGFSYSNGCDGAGAFCNDTDCGAAFRKSDDNFVQVACQEDDVNLSIYFCLED